MAARSQPTASGREVLSVQHVGSVEPGGKDGENAHDSCGRSRVHGPCVTDAAAPRLHGRVGRAPSAFHGLLRLVDTLIGVVPNCDRYLEIWPPAFRTYNIMVPNLLNLPVPVFGVGGPPAGVVGLAMYVSSRTAGCAYCSAHTCSFALRRGAAPDKVAAALLPHQSSFTRGELAAVAVARSLASVPCELTMVERDRPFGVSHAHVGPRRRLEPRPRRRIDCHGVQRRRPQGARHRRTDRLAVGPADAAPPHLLRISHPSMILHSAPPRRKSEQAFRAGTPSPLAVSGFRSGRSFSPGGVSSRGGTLGLGWRPSRPPDGRSRAPGDRCGQSSALPDARGLTEPSGRAVGDLAMLWPSDWPSRGRLRPSEPRSIGDMSGI